MGGSGTHRIVPEGVDAACRSKMAPWAIQRARVCIPIGFLARVPTLLKIGTRSAFERKEYTPTHKVGKTHSAFERNFSDYSSD